MSKLDPRRHAYRADLADAGLEGKVTADHFVDGKPETVRQPVAPIYVAPDRTSARQTEVLLGEPVSVFERKDGWAWIQSQLDGYVGYVESSMLAANRAEPSHVVQAAGTYIYRQPDMKSSPLMALSLGSRVQIGERTETRGTDYARLTTGIGYVVTSALQPLPLATAGSDIAIATALSLQGRPYLWAGRSSAGLDCSALIQLALMMAGHGAPRDSDMQQAELGSPVDDHDNYRNLQPGDLIFWAGHVGMMIDQTQLIHANGHSMSVAVEPLRQAIDRIGYLYAQPRAVHRLNWATPGTLSLDPAADLPA